MSDSSETVKKYLNMDLRQLRALCIKQELNGITRKSNRQQCVNAILEISKQSTNHNKTNNRRRSLSNSTPHNRQSAVSRSHSSNRKSVKRSRKRRRTEMDQDTGFPVPTMERSSKRRRTSNPSTMTTPERAIRPNKSPLRNPRIPQTFQQQAPLPPAEVMNFQSNDFLNLLDDSSDDDIDITDRNQNTRSPKQKPNIMKPSSPLAIMKHSSPEDSELDVDSESEHRLLPSNQHKNTHVNNVVQSESEDDESTQSESETESESDHPPQTYHRNTYNHEDDLKSRSRSRSKPRNTRMTSTLSNTLRSKSKPQYKRVASNITQRNTTNMRPQSIPISPIRSYAPQHRNNNISIQDTHPQHRAFIAPPVVLPSPPISEESQLMRTVKNMIYIIFFLPSKMYSVLKFIWNHLRPIFVALVIIAVLYSPTIKMLQSIDFQSTAEGVLQSLRIIPTIRYCDTNNTATDDSACKACPANAACIDGYLYCNGEKRLIKGECVYDEKELAKLQNEMQSHSLYILSIKRGTYECAEYRLYRSLLSLWKTNEENDQETLSKVLCEKELKDELSKALQIDSTSHLFQNVFEKFTESIKETKSYKSVKGLRYDNKSEEYYSTKSYRSVLCYAVVFVSDNCLLIIPGVLALSVLSVLWFKRRIKMNKTLRRRQLAKDRKKDVICIMQNFMNNSNQRWIPIDQIRVQILGEGTSHNSNSDEEWNRVERLVDRDANVQKSAQMVDGLQKLCWKLSDTALIH